MTGAPRRPSKQRGGVVTLAMVAHRAGVSPQTVSNALNNPGLLHPDTLARVQQAIDAMGYRPHRAAQTLRTRSSKLIGYGVPVAAPGTSSPVLDRFLHALSRTADEAGYRILLFAAPDTASSTAGYEELLNVHNVDGFVLSNTVRGDQRQAWLNRRGIAFTAFGRMWSGRQIGDWVDVDGAAGAAAAVAHLVGLGHERIGFLGWPPGSGVGDDRARGWKEAMRRHDLPVRGRRAVSTEDVAEARAAVGPLLDAGPGRGSTRGRGPGVTAVVAASDVLAMGCYQALYERGRVPGRDVAVAGFDDSPVAAMLSPGLTSVAQPLETVGRECVRLLLARMAAADRPTEHRLLAPSLTVRGSTSPAAP